MSFRLASVTLPQKGKVDIDIADQIITAITPAGSVPCTGESFDLDGHIVVPSFVEPHAHLDKALLADRIQNPTGDLLGAIQGLEAVRDTITFDDIVNRAVTTAQLMSRNGVTSIRTHADTTIDNGLTSVLALLEVKRLCASFIDIQIAMLLGWPVTGVNGAESRALARDAIAAGVDVVGGCPHLDPNPHEAVEYFLQLALESTLPLDLHADENLRTTSDDLEYLADLMLADNVTHQVSASHCVSLSIQSESVIHRTAEKVARAGITVTALPHTNLFLQGRAIFTSVPRAITPVDALRRAGVIVAAGADNVQDPFNPMGKADPLETASLMVMAAHQSPDNALELVSTAAAQVVHGHSSNIEVGETANLVAIPASNVREAIAMGPPDRFVVYGGVAISHQKRNIK
jgi:cytosine/creatinine deaminase